MSDGLADVHLLHFSTGQADKDLLLASESSANERAPHLAAYGDSLLLAGWETSTQSGELGTRAPRTLMLQVLDRQTGAAVGAPFAAGVSGNRYQDFRSFPDGSVAYAAPGSSSSKVKVLRVLPCSP